jgi:polyphosphate kinase
MLLADAISQFKIENLKLAKVIKREAFTSDRFPYCQKISEKKYEKQLRLLQIELLKLQTHLKNTGEKLLLIMEGRDAAGKGGTILRVTQHLNPRSVRVVALSKPTDEEKKQPYFTRYLKETPKTGEMVIFDRSWYNRAVVEPVMGFCTPEQTAQFYKDVGEQEEALTTQGVKLLKIWLHVGHVEQLKRLHARYNDPLKRWKLSPVDFAGIPKWDDYSIAIETMLSKTDYAFAPWLVVHSNDKNRARLAVIRAILNQYDYKDKNYALVEAQDEKIALAASTFLKAGGED